MRQGVAVRGTGDKDGRLSVRFGRSVSSAFPEFFEAVVLPVFLVENVHHDVEVIE